LRGYVLEPGPSQHQHRANNSSEQFCVPLGRGVNAAIRYQGQLAFTF
jgi:hypothetical protein